jgi:hypothetical protein
MMKHRLNHSGAEFLGHFHQCHAQKVNKITKMRSRKNQNKDFENISKDVTEHV